MSGKGSTTRPSSVPKSVLDANWERTFGRYAEEQALAKRVAVDLRGILAKLEDTSATPCHDFLPSTGSPDDDPAIP